MTGTTQAGSGVAPALEVLLAGAVDYAGLFPPASLDMRTAVTRYHAYRQAPHAWMLGRFVLPAARLDEFMAVAKPLAVAGEPAWRLSALVSHQMRADFAHIERFRAAHNADARGPVRVDALEIKVSPERVAWAIETLTEARHDEAARFEATIHRQAAFELPWDVEASVLSLVKATGSWAKFRTGGVVASAFPRPEVVARALWRAACVDVPMKFTAGLHHALRSEYPLTYAADSPRGTMFGFLNLLLAVALARRLARDVRMDEFMAVATLLPLLEEERADRLAFNASHARWREVGFDLGALAEARVHGAVSFGSCSFDEPVAELALLK
jgi:hypothetical protein